MVFLACMTAMQWLCLGLCFRMLGAVRRREITPSQAMCRAFPIMVPALLSAGPLLLEIAQVARFEQGQPIGMNENYSAVLCIAAAGIAALLLFGYRLHNQRQQPEAVSFASTGATAIGLMIGVYFLIVVGQHFAFFTPGNQDDGVANWSFLRDKGQITDMECNSDMVAVKDSTAPVITYRCPYLLVFNRFSPHPLIPWPDYRDGQSQQLSNTLRQLQADARRPIDH